MPRKANMEDIEKLQECINQQKGKRMGYWAGILGWSREKVARVLTSSNDKGILYSENKGRLYPFGDED